MRNPQHDPLGSGIPAVSPATHDDHARADAGMAGSEASGPERRCVLSGRIGPREDLIRLAISPAGDVLPDVLARAPGRGAWIGVTRAELVAAQAKGRLKGALARAFKGAALTIPDGLGQMIEVALRRTVTDRLGMAMRSGALILGTDRIAEQARMGKVAWLGHASDASEDGSRKLDQAWRVGSDAEGSGQAGIRLPLDRAALSVAMGRHNVVHLALADASAAARVTGPLARLLHFSGARPQAQTGGNEIPPGRDDTSESKDVSERYER